MNLPRSPAWKAAAWKELPWNWEDAARAQVGHFGPSRAAERAYERVLRNLASRIAGVLTGHEPRKAEDILREYARAIAPWARQSAANMLGGVARGNLAQFRRISSRMGIDMRAFLAGDPVGQVVERRIEENTALITSLPLEAARRVGALAHEGLVTGSRAEDMAEEVRRLGDLTRSRARCIALTEVSKASTALTQARAENVGSEGYIWRSMRDGSTRPSHRAMEGKYVPWDQPPTLDRMTGHAGEFPYCRCYPEPVIPRGDDTRRTFAPALPTQKQEEAAGRHRLLTQWERSAGAEVIPHVEGEPLPNVGKAAFLQEKLTRYALDFSNERGRHKARVFQSVLGVTARNAADVERQVMAALPDAPARASKVDKHGQHFHVDVPVTGPNGKTATVRTSWIYDRLEGDAVSNRPRLTSIFVK